MKGRKKGIRIVRNLLLAAVLFCLFYIFAGCPDMTAEQAYRREMQRRMLGPGEVIGTVNVDINGYDRLLLGETEEGVTLYCYEQANLGLIKGNTFSSWEGTLTYREKGETVTLLAAPGVNAWRDEIHLPLVLFDECPKAVRAELDVCIEDEYDSQKYTFRYSLSAERKFGGYFVFDLYAENEDETGGSWVEGCFIEWVSDLYADSFTRSGQYPATVRLYDEKDSLIYEEELFLRSAAGEAHAARGETME